MIYIVSNSNNPYFNISTEEYLLRKFDSDILFLYINNSSVIIGKHQNPFSETDYLFTVDNNIPLIRRISGGGAVYHDQGNLNFCFISNSQSGKQINFEKYTKPVIEVLNTLNIPAKLGARNNIFINGFKISGNAEHIFKNRVLHHGTLLFDTDLDILNRCLAQNKYINDNAVKSVPAKVTNIKNFVNQEFTINQLTKKICNYFADNLNYSEYKLSNIDIDEISKLVDTKYQTWEWNFAYTKHFEVNRQLIVGNYNIEIKIIVKDCIIQDIIFNIENIPDEILEFCFELRNYIDYCKYDYHAISNKIKMFFANRQYITNFDANLTRHFF